MPERSWVRVAVAVVIAQGRAPQRVEVVMDEAGGEEEEHRVVYSPMPGMK